MFLTFWYILKNWLCFYCCVLRVFMQYKTIIRYVFGKFVPYLVFFFCIFVFVLSFLAQKLLILRRLNLSNFYVTCQWFSGGGPPSSHPQSIWQCLRTFLIDLDGLARAESSVIHRTGSPSQNDSIQNVSSQDWQA